MKTSNLPAIDPAHSNDNQSSTPHASTRSMGALELTIPGQLSHVTSPPAHVAPCDAAKYLGVCEKTLAIWRCTKRYPLPYIKIGRLVRYRISDLQAFMDSRTVTAD